jgi:type II secretory pathway pseudopilin PulG
VPPIANSENATPGVALTSHTTNLNRQSGITLAEFVVVLIIVGLLFAAAIKTREIITDTKIKRLGDDYAVIAAAILEYQESFDTLPGDDAAAATRFSGNWRASDNGDGDGAIEGSWNSDDNDVEARKLWRHLRAAALMPLAANDEDAAYGQPGHPFGHQIGIAFRIHNFVGHSVVFANISGQIAQLLDSRGDDGDPSRGIIQSHRSESSYSEDKRYDVAFEL